MSEPHQLVSFTLSAQVETSASFEAFWVSDSKFGFFFNIQ